MNSFLKGLSNEAIQKLNCNNRDVQTVYAIMCTALVISCHVCKLLPFRACSIFFMNRVAQVFTTKSISLLFSDPLPSIQLPSTTSKIYDEEENGGSQRVFFNENVDFAI